MNDVKIICVCGAGTMGSGIAQVAAQAGFSDHTIRSKSRNGGKKQTVN